MNIEEARRIAQRHEDTYNNNFEGYGDLYADGCVIYRPAQGVTHDKATMLALEQRATAACPDRRTRVLGVFAGEGETMGFEERWDGTNTGGDAAFGPVGTKVSVYAFTVYEVRGGKFARSVAWTGRPASPEVLQ